MKKSAAQLITYILTVTALVYAGNVLPAMLPGDFYSAMYSSSDIVLNEEQINFINKNKESLDTGFCSYIGNLLSGDLGTSFVSQEPVTELIMKTLPWTLLLGGLAQILSIITGFIAGVESGWHRGTGKEKGITTGLIILESVPELVTGTLLILIFAFTLGIFPSSGAETTYSTYTGFTRILDIMHHLALPLIAILITLIPGNYLMMRNSMLMVMNEKYIVTAHAKNLSDRRIRYVHGARNALMPLVTRIGIRTAHMITGLIVIETIFKYPGMGTLLSTSIQMRDIPVIRGIILITSVMVVTLNFMLEFLYRYLDPRLRNEN